jgi:hypothetical protein
VEAARDRLGLTGDLEADCVRGELDARPDLAMGLGDQPLASSRFGELSALAASCKARSDGSRAVVDRVRSSPGVHVDDVGERCLFSSLSRYDLAELDRLHGSGGGPGELEDRLHELLVICGVVSLT